MTLPYSVFFFLVLTRAVFELRLCARTFDRSTSRPASTAPADEEDFPSAAEHPGTLAGVPRHILESERIDRGALLRDTLLLGPPPRNY